MMNETAIFAAGCFFAAERFFGAAAFFFGIGRGCSRLTRLPSGSANDTYAPTPGISMGSPSTCPPAPATFVIACLMSSTAITTEGCCTGQSAFFGKKPPLMRPGCFGNPSGPAVAVVART